MTEGRRERAPEQTKRHARERTKGSRPRDDRPKRRLAEGEESPTEKAEGSAADAERRLARALSVGAPVVTVLAALAVGTLVSFGSAILVLAGGALFGTIAFFWASLRTLGGDAPLAAGFDQMSQRRVEAPDSPEERKKAALRGLKDLEFEHSLGKIDDEDYAELSARYREEAKAILRELDLDAGPRRARAEELAKSYLAKRGFSADGVPRSGKKAPAEAPVTREADEEVPAPSSDARVACPACEVSNEKDAVFCKKCGARLSPFECPKCTTLNEPDAAFCKKCGKALASKLEDNSDAAS
jgi:Double zinc ribbon